MQKMNKKSGVNFIKVGMAAKLLGVSVDTLRRWEIKGKLLPERTPGGTRVYATDQLKRLNPLLKNKEKQKFWIKLPKYFLPTSLGAMFTLLAVAALTLAIYLAFTYPYQQLSGNLTTTIPVDAGTSMDNSNLNRSATLIAAETSDLVTYSAKNLNGPAVNWTGVDASWTLTQEDCVKDLINRGL